MQRVWLNYAYVNSLMYSTGANQNRSAYHLSVCARFMLLLQSLHKVNSIEIVRSGHTCGTLVKY